MSTERRTQCPQCGRPCRLTEAELVEKRGFCGLCGARFELMHEALFGAGAPLRDADLVQAGPAEPPEVPVPISELPDGALEVDFGSGHRGLDAGARAVLAGVMLVGVLVVAGLFVVARGAGIALALVLGAGVYLLRNAFLTPAHVRLIVTHGKLRLTGPGSDVLRGSHFQGLRLISEPPRLELLLEGRAPFVLGSGDRFTLPQLATIKRRIERRMAALSESSESSESSGS